MEGEGEGPVMGADATLERMSYIQVRIALNFLFFLRLIVLFLFFLNSLLRYPF